MITEIKHEDAAGTIEPLLNRIKNLHTRYTTGDFFRNETPADVINEVKTTSKIWWIRKELLEIVINKKTRFVVSFTPDREIANILLQIDNDGWENCELAPEADQHARWFVNAILTLAEELAE